MATCGVSLAGRLAWSLLRDQAGAEVLVDFAAQGAQDLGGLHRVDRAAAAEADDHVRIGLPQLVGDSQQILPRGIGPGSLESGRYEVTPDRLMESRSMSRQPAVPGESGVQISAARLTGGSDDIRRRPCSTSSPNR